jgi:hypothetical protein
MKPIYRGVACLRCRSPIPVTSKVSALYDEIQETESDMSGEPKPFSFTLRCRVCGEESVYTTSEIEEFEGAPKTRRRYGPPRTLRFRAENG